MACLRSDPAHATFTIAPRGPFSLAAAARFWGGFTPAAHPGMDAEGHVHMAFPVERGWMTAGVCVRETEGVIVGTVFGAADVEAVRQQTARILSLDVDGRSFLEIGQRDAVAGALQRRWPGLRPVCFYSPYEAATWAILSQRLRGHQAAAIKRGLSEALGERILLHGQALAAFPAPPVLAAASKLPGVPDTKRTRLQAMAAAAVRGELDAAYLRSLLVDEALAHLQRLPGIGPFSAQLILLRGAGHPDVLTFEERRFRRAVGAAYGLDHVPTDDDLRRISDRWRPYRTWITFLLRQAAEVSADLGAPADPGAEPRLPASAGTRDTWPVEQRRF